MHTPTFLDLGVPAPVAERLAADGITAPFAIQTAVVPDALAGRDVIGRAPTGSGKTLAFGIPLVSRLTGAQRRRPTALVLAPTRELAEQIMRELAPLAEARGHRAAAVYGGVGYGAQKRALDAGTELIVACPGRLEDLLSMNALDLGDVEFVVIDEADRMADMGFLPAVERIVARTAPGRQTLLFSATLDRAVTRLSDSVQTDPNRYEVGPEGPDLSAARHVFWKVDSADRVTLTADVVGRLGSVMVFCRTRHGADRVAKQLGRAGVSAASIHGGRSQSQRDRALGDFSDGRVMALIATDVAARGVHVDDVAGVVHFDPPADAATYIHRSGRTARAGATGVVVSLWIPEVRSGVRDIQKGVDIEVVLTEPDLDVLGARPSTPRVVRDAVAPSTPRHQASPSSARQPARPTHTAERNDRPAANDRPSRRRRARSRDAATSVDRGRSNEGRAQSGLTGTVVSFNSGKGFGFIDAGGERDVFVHHTNLTGAVRLGQRVRFDVRAGQRGPEAVAVHPI